MNSKKSMQDSAHSFKIVKGKAPGMQVQLLSEEHGRREYAVIFGKGDEAISGLNDFAEDYHVTSAHFTAIGMFRVATLGSFSIERKERLAAGLAMIAGFVDAYGIITYNTYLSFMSGNTTQAGYRSGYTERNDH